jgi:hypothetical protein
VSATGRYDAFVARLRTALLESPGETEPSLRRDLVSGSTSLPAEIAAYVEKVRRHAYKITDEDIASLARAGYSEDRIFEITASAAVGAALHRLERGMAALKDARP